jgi:hypothetical protein
MKRIYLIFVVVLLLFLPLISSVGEVVTPDLSTQNLIVQENVKTRTEVKNYLDNVKSDLTVFVMKEGNKYVREQFELWNNNTRNLINLLIIKIVIYIIGAMLLGQLLFYLIKIKLLNLREKRFDKRELLKQQEQLKKDIITPQVNNNVSVPVVPIPPIPPPKIIPASDYVEPIINVGRVEYGD